jgi:phosphopantothenoylcysteine decarboxylase/phosphopantothenate--cysteine ligase
LTRRLENRRILLGVTGGIAAYKACEVLRALQREGAEVRVMMTENAQKFIAPLTFEALSKQEVVTSLFPPNRVVTTHHISTAEWAECILICPASLNCIGKVASGVADDFVTTTVSAARTPVIFAPAMDSRMAVHPVFLSNCERLKSFGFRFVSHETGELASGAEGPGRLARLERILDAVHSVLTGSDRMKGLKVLVTAGPTREPLDPVRFISNRSSGKMGYALAEEAMLRGADVTLVSGAAFAHVADDIRCLTVHTTRDMAETVAREWNDHGVLIMSAAVADYRPVSVSEQKMKRGKESLSLQMEKTDDILKQAASVKGDRIVVGFALETENGPENAMRKLLEKNLDLVCLNNPLEHGAGFETDTNRITLIDRDRNVREMPLMPKWEAARCILDAVEPLVKKR